MEPVQWAWYGGKRRKPVLDFDHIPPRIVRKIGWRKCLKCTNPFISQDVIAIRMWGAC